MRPDILIQNVSAQCIPNLVAARSFHPRKIIWVCTPEFEGVLQRLRQQTIADTSKQQVWMVDARDAESMHKVMLESFARLKPEGDVIYHLTGGTKSMSLQGLYNLGTFRRKSGAGVYGVVMDPRSQQFDTVYPHAANNARPCTMLSLDEILHVHGNAVFGKGRSMQELSGKLDELERMRVLAPAIKRELIDRQISKQDEAGFYRLSGVGGLPSGFCKGLEIAQRTGVLHGLEISGVKFRCTMRGSGDPVAWVRNMWMEDWAGAVLGSGLSGWQGGGAGMHVRIGKKSKSGMDKQEFDFIGARNNHLVYWSCKNVKEISPAPLFEVDALRDEVGGRDFHVAGLLYAGLLKPGIAKKARRLGVELVDVFAADAAERLLRISGG